MKNKKLAKKISKKVKCVFCGEEFELSQVLYVRDVSEKDDFGNENISIDKVFKDFISKGFLAHDRQSQDLERKYVLCENWIELVSARKESELPEALESANYVISNSVFNPEEKETAETKKKEPIVFGKASKYILCPHCHSRLPEGFHKYPVIRIGMFGGKRSGKTSFITACTRYMQSYGIKSGNRMIAKAEVAAESRDLLEYLRKEMQEEKGTNATMANEKKVFPMVVTITPEVKDRDADSYSPFFLVLQDIPGEEAEKNIKLVDNEVYRSIHAFLSIVDINMFVETKIKAELKQLENDKRKADLNAEGKNEAEVKAKVDKIDAEMKKIEELINMKKPEEIFTSFAFSKFMKNLHSIQLVLTKIDLWLNDETDENLRRILQGEGGILSETPSCRITDDMELDAEVLGIFSRNIQNTLEEHYFNRENTGYGSLMDRLLGCFDEKIKTEIAKGETEQEREEDKIRYCAVACPPGRFGEEGTRNVLDPIMNVCIWENLLPNTSNPRKKTGKWNLFGLH